MIVLNIYSLDDTENQNVIACLPEGKHVIGRGDLLQVTDKRVSRKHAVIEVLSGKVCLTSLHINPCFFKAANGKTLSVLSQNQQNELNDGDQFALLPEDYWFKVKIKRENLSDGPINGDSAGEINNIKRNHDNIEGNDANSDPKRARLSITSIETSIPSGSGATTSNITLEETNNIQSNEASHNRSENEALEISNIQNREASHNHSEHKGVTEQLQEADTKESNTSLNKKDTEANATENNEVLTGQIKEEPKENGKGDAPPNIYPIALKLEPHCSTSIPEIKEEPSSTSNNEDNPRENETASENDISNDEHPQEEAENADNDNQNKDGASGSGTGTKERRERCWYGAQCFRKNPNHRQSFSHPGDQDYDSDPDDDRPDCPFGAGCYRQNINHRRQYKHVGRPAPKPSNVNVTLNVNKGCPFCEHCNGKKGGGGGRKPDYESDADDEFYEF